MSEWQRQWNNKWCPWNHHVVFKFLSAFLYRPEISFNWKPKFIYVFFFWSCSELFGADKLLCLLLRPHIWCHQAFTVSVFRLDEIGNLKMYFIYFRAFSNTQQTYDCLTEVYLFWLGQFANAAVEAIQCHRVLISLEVILVFFYFVEN